VAGAVYAFQDSVMSLTTSRRTQWLVSLVIFAAIILALIVAAVLADPFAVTVP
jgi:hypothetical protein